MKEVHRNSVQSWECDVMGHMNVQFYAQKALQGLSAFTQSLKTPSQGYLVREQHFKFLREIQAGVPFYITAGLVNNKDKLLSVYQEIHHALDGKVMATIHSTLEIKGDMHTWLEALGAWKTPLPDYGKPRGVSTAPAPNPLPNLAKAQGLKNMVCTYQNEIMASDCDKNGQFYDHGFMAAVSNAVPNLLIQLRDGQHFRQENIGGAALENRFLYHNRPKDGDIVLIYSGLKALANKTYTFMHWMFNSHSGACLAMCEVIAISFDLKARKAVAIEGDMRAAMESKLVGDTGI